MKYITEIIKSNNIQLNLIDIGCSGGLDPKWKEILPDVNYYGFDPNEDECIRLASLPTNYKNANYLPYAVSGHDGPAKLYKTRSIYCYSLLKPDMSILGRFSFASLFDLVGEELLDTITLDSCKELSDVHVDIIKIDAQGLEKAILEGGKSKIRQALYVETESGFTPNYIGESTQADVDIYMREQGFLLFDMLTYRMPYSNNFADLEERKSQLLWAESVWLRDLIAMYSNNDNILTDADRIIFLKMTLLCAVLGAYDYGLALVQLGHKLGLLSDDELNRLSKIDNWLLVERVENNESVQHSRLLNWILRLLPLSIRLKIQLQIGDAINQKHLFKL